MKPVLAFAVIAAFCLVLMAAAPEEKSPKPQYDAKGNLLRPEDYRDWEFLSAGYGMNYCPAPDSHEMFTNVFVQRWAYQEFLKFGQVARAVHVHHRRARRREQKAPSTRKDIIRPTSWAWPSKSKTRRAIPTSGPTTVLSPTAKPPKPCQKETDAGPATSTTLRSSTLSCSSIPR